MIDEASRWLRTNIGVWVMSYIEAGYAVFPVHGIVDGKCTCGNFPCGKDNASAGKHPATSKGFKNATKSVEAAEVMFRHSAKYNVGIATGEVSGIVVIDVDQKEGKDGEESLKKLQLILGELPPGPVVNTGGGGRHLVFEYNQDQKLKNVADAFGRDAYPGVDIRADGGYVVWPPSKHISGKEYSWDPETAKKKSKKLPQEWVDALRTPKERKDKDYVGERPYLPHSPGERSEWTESDVLGMLSYINADEGSYEDWYSVGFALHNEGFGCEMWDTWSRAGSLGKYEPGCCYARWPGFKKGGGITIGTLIDRVKTKGWQPNPEQERKPRGEIEIVNPIVKKVIERRKKTIIGVTRDPSIYTWQNRQPTPFPMPPLDMEGPIGDTVRWICEHAIFEQPELALLNVLAFAGAVFGRRYTSPVRTMTNIYLVGTARTGAGKDHSRKMMNMLAVEAGLENFMGANKIRSETGLLQSLVKETSQLMMIDEFGMFVRALADPSSPHHIRMITAIITQLYSDSGGVYNHGALADARSEPIVIKNPCLSIYGTTTEESYLPALKRATIETGELNRFVVISSPVVPLPKRNVPSKIKFGKIADFWRKFSPKNEKNIGGRINDSTFVPDPITVEWGDCDDLQFNILEEQCLRTSDKANHTASLWNRYWENTLKIAMIFAIVRNPKEPVFMKDDLIFSRDLVQHSISYMESMADAGMSETQHEANTLEVLKFMKQKGNPVSRTELLRRFRKFKPKEMDDLLLSLLNQETVHCYKVVHTGGREGVMYKLTNPNLKLGNIEEIEISGTEADSA